MSDGLFWIRLAIWLALVVPFALYIATKLSR